IPDGTRDQDLAAFRGCRNASADDDGEPSRLPVDELALARVDADPDSEAELRDAIADRAGTRDRARRTVEAARKEPVAGSVDGVARMSLEHASNPCVVLAQQLRPARPEIDGRRSRADEVGEEH